jgi:putative transposase
MGGSGKAGEHPSGLCDVRSFRGVLPLSTAVERRDPSLPAGRVIRSLEQIIEWRGKPNAIRCDNGPEYISGALQRQAQAQNIRIHYIQPGKPQQNAYVERYNRTVRHEWLEMNEFNTIEEAQLTATQWLWTYNNERPNMAIGGITCKTLDLI